jgi:dTDP-4-dehydrorhamnose 3,5-epimerase-like enzyme
MTGITIQQILPKNPNDPRGETVELFQGRLGKQVTLYRRVKGAKFGNHFHKGDDPSKNPEIFYLISGEVVLSAENGKTHQTEQFTVTAGHQILIDPGVYHEFEALCDVVFIEYRATVFDPAHPDCYTKDEYEEYLLT